MLHIPKLRGKLAFVAALITIILFLLNLSGRKEEVWRRVKSDLISENAELKHEMDYSDTLTRQSSITLGPLAFGGLDFFNRRLYDHLFDLYQAGQDETIHPSQLNLKEL
jgi:hypothetical protein